MALASVVQHAIGEETPERRAGAAVLRPAALYQVAVSLRARAVAGSPPSETTGCTRWKLGPFGIPHHGHCHLKLGEALVRAPPCQELPQDHPEAAGAGVGAGAGAGAGRGRDGTGWRSGKLVGCLGVMGKSGPSP